MAQPPFDRTISEGSGDGAGLKVEGNNGKPFGEDFLQDVISLQWNSGLFFVTTIGGGFFGDADILPDIYRSKGGKKWKGPAEVDQGMFIDPGLPAIRNNAEVFAAVGGKIHDGEQGKILVVAGDYGYAPTEGLTNAHTVLSFSYDGETWERVSLPYVYEDNDKFDNLDIDVEVDNLLFIPETKIFYADVFYANGIWSRDLLSSGDGMEWSKASSNTIPEDDVFTNPPFNCNFVNLAISTQDDNGFTGVTSPQTGTVLKFSNIRAVPGFLGGEVEFDNPVLRNGEPIDVPGLTVDGLCYAGGVFLVSGHFNRRNAAVYRSTDDGKTWKKVLAVDISQSSGFRLMCGGA